MYEYRLIRSDRRTLSLEISPNLEIIVRSPYGVKQEELDSFVKKHEAWIGEKLEKMKRREKSYPKELSEKEIKALIEKARLVLPKKLSYYSRLMGLYPTAVKITAAKTRFGSCGGKNSVCFSYRLMLYPEKAIDYVVVHELAHIKHKNHGKEFYALIEKYLPDYKERERLLKL